LTNFTNDSHLILRQITSTHKDCPDHLVCNKWLQWFQFAFHLRGSGIYMITLSSGLDIFGGVRIQPFGRQLGTFSIDMATVYGRGIDYFWLSVETWADYKTDCILIYNFLCFRCDFAFGFAIFVFCHDFHHGQKCLTSRRRL